MKKVPQDKPKKKEPSTDETTQVRFYSIILHMQSIDFMTKINRYQMDLQKRMTIFRNLLNFGNQHTLHMVSLSEYILKTKKAAAYTKPDSSFALEQEKLYLDILQTVKEEQKAVLISATSQPRQAKKKNSRLRYYNL